MLIFIAIHLLFSRSVYAAPTGIAPRADPTDQHRTTQQIVTSCLSTFTLCTWSAMHPNIPPHTDGETRRYFRKLRFFLSLLILPETIVIWATLQCMGARKLASTPQFKARGWKMPHGFFAQMGGFVLHDADGKRLHVVWSHDVCKMLDSPLIESPLLTEEELQDRSKSDVVAKTIAVLQTISFFAQCITRLVKQLPITELELITFTYTIVNVYIYIVFWEKPQNVGYAFPVYEKSVANGGRRRWERVPSLLSQDDSERLGRRLVTYLKLACAAPFHGINAWAVNQEPNGIQAMAVPDLYYHEQKRASSGRILAFTALVGTAFGASHLIAWNVKLGYPSSAEEIAWRVCCIALTGIPPILLVFVLIGTSDRQTKGPDSPINPSSSSSTSSRTLSSHQHAPKNVLGTRILVSISASLGGPLMILFYVPARLALLVLPFAALRKLPDEIYIDTPLPSPFKFITNWQA